MIFSYESAMRELKQLNDNGGQGMYMLKNAGMAGLLLITQCG